MPKRREETIFAAVAKSDDVDESFLSDSKDPTSRRQTTGNLQPART